MTSYRTCTVIYARYCCMRMSHVHTCTGYINAERLYFRCCSVAQVCKTWKKVASQAMLVRTLPFKALLAFVLLSINFIIRCPVLFACTHTGTCTLLVHGNRRTEISLLYFIWWVYIVSWHTDRYEVLPSVVCTCFQWRSVRLRGYRVLDWQAAIGCFNERGTRALVSPACTNFLYTSIPSTYI